MDLSLFYFGGSGGFLLLHLLLMSGKFYAAGVDINNLEQQWDIIDPAKWKDNEVWPNNAATTSAITDRTKLYFNCNDYTNWSNYTQNKLLLYVDLDTQLKLAKYKNAWVYNQTAVTPNQQKELLEKIQSNAITIDGKRYFAKLLKLFDCASIKIDLIDLIKNPKLELSKLDIVINQRQINLVRRWVELHNGLITV